VIERLYTQHSKPTQILNDAKKAASKMVEKVDLGSARNMTGTILVIMEQQGGAWNRISWETLACANQLAVQIDGTVSAAVVGQDIGALADELAQKKLYKAYAINHDLLKVYTADGFSSALEQFIRQVNPSIVLFPHTYQARDFAPRLATRFNQVLVSDVIGFRAEGGSPMFVRQLFQGRLSADIQPGGFAPHFASIRAGTFPTDHPEAGLAQVEGFTPTLDSSDIRERPREPFQESLARGEPD
jgi:electron transfer flavoprotein alpha subunit